MDAHHVDLPVALGEPDHRDVVVLREPGHRPPELGPDLLHDRGGRDRIPQVRGHERDHLTADLQIRHVAVEIDPIQTGHIQHHVPIQKIANRRSLGHTHQRHPRSTPQTGPHLGGQRRSLAGRSLDRAGFRRVFPGHHGGFMDDPHGWAAAVRRMLAD
jgi:hypothetical protein